MEKGKRNKNVVMNPEASRSSDGLTRYVMGAKEFLAADFPPVKLMVDPWLTDSGIVLLHAPPGVGKTFILLGLAVAITRRKAPDDFCGWKIKNRAGVLYIDGEMVPQLMQQRLAKVEAAYPDNPMSSKRQLSILSCANLKQRARKKVDLSCAQSREQIMETIENSPAQVIIFDNIVSLTKMKDENTMGSWTEINQWLIALRSMHKSIILVHHSANSGGPRGTSHRCDNVDTILRLEKHRSGITVHFDKNRNFGGSLSAPAQIKFHIDDKVARFTRENFYGYKGKHKKTHLGSASLGLFTGK